MPQVVHIDTGQDVGGSVVVDHLNRRCARLLAFGVNREGQRRVVHADPVIAEIEADAHGVVADLLGRIPLKGVVDIVVGGGRGDALKDQLAGVVRSELLRDVVSGVSQLVAQAIVG